MECIATPIEGLLMVRPQVHNDDRGQFVETWNQRRFDEAVGRKVRFVQSNQSRSQKHVLRGLHFQVPPNGQGKLVWVSQGLALDVAVDLRKDSPTFGQHWAVELSPGNGIQFWIPEGFAHGFLALEEDTVFEYMCTEFYAPQSEQSLLWNDPLLGIDWGVEAPRVSDKDAAASAFEVFDSPF